MIRAFGAGLVGRMQRETKKDQPAHATQQALRGGMRSHAPSQRLASSQKRQAGSRFGGGAQGSSDGGDKNRRRIRNAASLLHVRELVAKRGYVHISQLLGEFLQERMAHARACSVSEEQQPVRFRRPCNKPGNFALALHANPNFFTLRHFHAILAKASGRFCPNFS